MVNSGSEDYLLLELELQATNGKLAKIFKSHPEKTRQQKIWESQEIISQETRKIRPRKGNYQITVQKENFHQR